MGKRVGSEEEEEERKLKPVRTAKGVTSQTQEGGSSSSPKYSSLFFHIFVAVLELPTSWRSTFGSLVIRECCLQLKPKVGTGRKHNSPPTLGCGHSLQWCPCVVEEVALKVEWEGQDSLRPPPFSSPAPQGLGFPLKAHQCCTPHYILPFLHLGPLLRALTSVFCSPPPYSAA